MKKFFFALGQLILFALFLAIFSPIAQLFIAVFFHFRHLSWFVSHPTPTSIRFFDPTGFLLMTGFFLVVLAIEAVFRKLRTAGLWTTVMYVLALLIGLLAKFGWATHDSF